MNSTRLRAWVLDNARRKAHLPGVAVALANFNTSWQSSLDLNQPAAQRDDWEIRATEDLLALSLLVTSPLRDCPPCRK